MVEGHVDNGSGVCTKCGYVDGIPLASIPVGAYIEYAPSNETVTVLATDSGYTSDQTFTTSSYTSGWKVFKNNDGQIDIISSESLGNLTLKGATGYAKAVYTLNKMSNDYVNLEYATSGRSLGYKAGSSMETINTTTYPLTWASTNGSSSFPYVDTYYNDDKTIINTVVNSAYPLRHTNGDVWIASRTLGFSSNTSNFYVRNLSITGSDSGNALYSYSAGLATNTKTVSNGVRPVISLKPTIKIISGSGTQANPYIL